jgi:hypothetical protein
MKFSSKQQTTKSQVNASHKNQPQNDNLVKHVIDNLDHLNSNLSQQAIADIAQVRHKALLLAEEKQQQKTKQTLWQQFAFVIDASLPKLALPIGAVGISAALLLTLSVNYFSKPTIPEIPLAMASVDMPSEDLTLLAQLEFISWLAEHEQDSSL